MKIHIHIGGTIRSIGPERKLGRTRDDDFDLGAAYEQLAQLLLDYIAEHGSTQDGGCGCAKCKLTSDEEPGHPFHGNQYVEVAGQGGDEPKPKPSKAAPGPVKHQVHELLSSGHPFSLKELMDATGHQNEKTMKSFIGWFKDPKTAGKKGPLDIKKLPDGTYQIVKKSDGQPAPLAKADDPMKASPEEWNAAATIPETMAKLGAKPAEPPPAPVKAEEPAQTAPIKAKPPAGGMMNKEKADATYNVGVKSAVAALKAKLESDDGESTKHLLEFKQAKANAMAQWAANTKGMEVEAQKQTEVFEADKQLGNNLLSGKYTLKEALDLWKSNTAKEKQGLFKPYPPGQTAATAPDAPMHKAPAPTEPMLPVHTQHSLDAPAAIVPEGHAPIEMSDFAGPSGGKWGKGMAELYSKLAEGSQSAAGNKVSVEHQLQAHLQHSAPWQALKSKFQKGGYSLEATMISAWASSSGDHHAKSVASQLAVRDAFGLKPEEVETAAFHLLHEVKGDEQRVHKKAMAELGFGSNPTEGEIETFKAGMRDFALAQHKATQAYFKEKGITEVWVTRGMKIPFSEKARKIKLKLQPASSFSANLGTAHQFAGGGSLFAVKVPASQVLSTYRTGYGCSNEHEVVVIGHPSTEAVQVKAGHGSNKAAFAEHVVSAHVEAGGEVPAAKKLTPLAQAKAAIPKKPSGAKSVQCAIAKKAAEAGDVAGLKTALALVKPGQSLSLKYVESLLPSAEKIAKLKQKTNDSITRHRMHERML